jgi:hypothetical protein
VAAKEEEEKELFHFFVAAEPAATIAQFH